MKYSVYRRKQLVPEKIDNYAYSKKCYRVYDYRRDDNRLTVVGLHEFLYGIKNYCRVYRYKIYGKHIF